MIDKLVYSYVEHQEKKLHNISMAALVAKDKILKVISESFIQPSDQLKNLLDAIDDLDLIIDNLTKGDFKYDESNNFSRQTN